MLHEKAIFAIAHTVKFFQLNISSLTSVILSSDMNEYNN